MTELQFRYSPDTVPEALLQRAYFASWGRIPKPSRVRLKNGILTVAASVAGSGTLHLPWKHHSLGLMMQATDTLLPRERPYHLVKELSRGGLGRILRRLYDWQLLGFRPCDETRDEVRQAITRFAKMGTLKESSEAVEQLAVDLLYRLDALTVRISEEFTEQTIAWRRRNGENIPLRLVAGLGSHSAPDSLFEFDLHAEQLHTLFHAVAPMPTWREIEPEQGKYRWDLLEERFSVPPRFGFQNVAGPLIDFDQHALPVWLLPRLGEEGFFETRAKYFVEGVAERFDYAVESWILASRFNSHTLPGVPIFRGFSIIRNTAMAIRMNSPDKPVMIGINQPWGEYGLKAEPQFGLLNIAEALISCLEIDSFYIELNIGFESFCTYPRDPMAISTLIDQWSFLGKKVYAAISVPSGFVKDADTDEAFIEAASTWDAAVQQHWAGMLLRILLSKRNVHGVLWTVFQDSSFNPEDTHAFGTQRLPYSGLVDSERGVKPAFKELAELRANFVK